MTPARALPGWLDPLLVCLVAVAGHAPALSGTGFTYDDRVIVEASPRLVVRDSGDLLRLVRSDYWDDPLGNERLWRPLSLLTFALERRVHGGDADHYHRTNVALHALAAALSLPLLRAALRSRRGALLGALLFALHPVHAESVAGVVGRSEVLALLLVLLAFLAHRAALRPAPPGVRGLRRLRAPILVLCAAGCFFLAITAKEIAATGPFLLALFQRVVEPPGAPGGEGRLRRLSRLLQTAVPWIAYGLAIAAYVLCRWLVLGDLFARQGARTLGDLAFLDRALLACPIYLDSLLSLLVPHGTSAHYPFGGVRLDPLMDWLSSGRHPAGPPLPSWGAPLSVPLLLLHALLLGAALACLRARGWLRPLGLGLFGFYLALGPVSNLLVPIGVLRADRLLYTPSWWTCLALAALGQRLLRGSRPGPRCVGVGLLLGWWAALLVGNAAAWSRERELWEASLRRYPEEPRIHQALGTLLMADGELAAAEEHLRWAATRSPPASMVSRQATPLLGRCLVEQGKDREAETLLLELLRRDEENVTGVEALARLYLARADREADPTQRAHWARKAKLLLEPGVQMARGDQLWLLLARALRRIEGREPEAEAAYGQAVARSTRPWMALSERAELRRSLGQTEGALQDLRRVCDLILTGLGPPELFAQVLEQRAQLARELGQATEAQRCEELLARLRRG